MKNTYENQKAVALSNEAQQNIPANCAIVGPDKDKWTQYYRLVYCNTLSEPFSVILQRMESGMSVADSMAESAKQMRSFYQVVMQSA